MTPLFGPIVRLGLSFKNGAVDSWIIGDSGYPLRSWLLTPVTQPSPEEKNGTMGVTGELGLLWSRHLDCLNPVSGKPLLSCPILSKFLIFVFS